MYTFKYVTNIHLLSVKAETPQPTTTTTCLGYTWMAQQQQNEKGLYA